METPYLCEVRVGIFFGGAAREREVSYAGGRTVYDLLDRRRFLPIPLFLDAYHRPVRLKPEKLYYGMITDFFPPPEDLPPEVHFPLYAEQLYHPKSSAYLRALSELGPLLSWESVRESIDVAFLVLHGLGGEDGSIQGLLEQLGVPYVGTGIGSSAWGMDKARQRSWLEAHGFAVPRYTVLPRRLLWESPQEIPDRLLSEVGLPCVIKHPLQGSTIGIAFCHRIETLLEAFTQCSFTWPVQKLAQTPIPEILDLQKGLSLPILYRDREGIPREMIHTYADLQNFLRRLPAHGWVEAWDAPEYLLVERFLEGEEFSVILLEAPDGRLVALPPTHIRKESVLYDYRAKYLSGISSKRTPSPDLPNERIQIEAERLGQAANLEVYARIDGIVTPDGNIYFNDPNTTSGMLPASLLFHQAAEVGFTPASFLSYLIDRSLNRVRTGPLTGFERRFQLLHRPLTSETTAPKERIAVIFGGPSTERHISVESGRNVYQKLSSQYTVIPLFLRQVGEKIELWELPPRLLFKDNADDIAAHLGVEEVPPSTARSRSQLTAIEAYDRVLTYTATPVSWEELPNRADFVFLALHGRPGEDGTVQAILERLGLPYNGSRPAVCALLMDKYATHQFLEGRGFRVPPHMRVTKAEWKQDAKKVYHTLREKLGDFPWIGKPMDEGCSNGVRVLEGEEAVQAYLEVMFREGEAIPTLWREKLLIQPGELFPAKEEVLIERYLQDRPGERWIEVTVGVITHTQGSEVRYEVFFPSETVKETAILSLEEKFLAGAGQNITPARLFPQDPERNEKALRQVQSEVEAIARAVGIHGYARVDGFVRVIEATGEVQFWTLEINALPGLTPATVFFHQAVLAGYKPLDILVHLIREGKQKARRLASV
jgi:D-alanine-D-alanine ligase